MGQRRIPKEQHIKKTDSNNNSNNKSNNNSNNTSNNTYLNNTSANHEEYNNKGNDFLKSISLLIMTGIIFTILAFILDMKALILIQSIQDRLLIIFFSIITQIGEIGIFVLLLGVISIICILNRKPLTALWTAAIASGLISWIFKTVTLRPRPFEILNEPSIVATSLSSFPSGHAMAVFSILPILENEYPMLRIMFWIIALFVAFSRVYLKVHYLSDVVAGAFIGYITGLVILRISKNQGWT